MSDAEASPHWVNQYNVRWNSFSESSEDSMPCGGGDIGLNVWVENGEILFYVSRGDALDENNSLLKLGRVRLILHPNPFMQGEFSQELRLREAAVVITGGDGVSARIWCDIHRPVVYVDIESKSLISVEARYESWRIKDRALDTGERFQCMSFMGTTPEQFPVITRADRFEPGSDRIVWYHRNDDSDLVFDKEVIQQHLEGVRDRLWNPLKGRTFGGVIFGNDMVFDGESDGVYGETPFHAWSLTSRAPARQHKINIALHTEQADSLYDWRAGLERTEADAASTSDARERSLRWWSDFWDRSRIVLNPGAPPEDSVWRLGRNYQLFRYMLACTAYGEYPGKFNGGLFTVDAPPYTPDFRQWGGGSFTAQNQRLLYWPMLKSGDFDLMTPQFEFYRRSLKNAELRTQVYWGHEGASFTEQIENFGLPVGEIYDRLWGGRGIEPRQGDDHGALVNDWCEDLYDTVLEFCLMILDVEQFTGQDISEYLPLIESSVTFFDEHYQMQHRQRTGRPLDDHGKLVIYPGTACETYKKATNAAPTVAGLAVVISRLLALPPTYGTTEQRAHWEKQLSRIPDVPLREKDERTVIGPAQSWERINNEELPQLYPVFPYGLFGLGKPNLQIALDTWRFGADTESQKGNFGWKQHSIWCARLGRTDEARDLIAAKLADAPRRFPTFWGPNFDWTPDLNHGGSAMIALQEMLMQTGGSEIRLLPAWPTEWNVDFKLHVPYNTTVEGSVREGELIDLKVTPKHRQQDVIVDHSGKLKNSVLPL